MSGLANYFDYFFSTDRPAALIVNTIIVLIGFYSVFQLVSNGFALLKREQDGITRLRIRLRNNNSDTSLGAAPAENALRETLSRDREALLSKSPLLARRIAQLEGLRCHGDDINQESLSAILVSELESQAAFARWASSAVVLLGLTGTLLGLTQAVRSAAIILGKAEGATVTQAVTAVTQTFSGVQVAFSATLMGVFWATVLGMGVTLLRQKQGTFLRALEELTTVELIPLYRTSVGLSLSQTAQNLARMEEQLRNALVGVLQELARRGDQLLGSLEYRFDSLTARYDERSGKLLNHFEATHVAVSKLLGDQGSSAVSVTDALSSLQRGAEDVRASVEAAGSLIPGLKEAIGQQIDRQSADLTAAANSYAATLREGLDTQSAAIQKGLETFDQFIPALAETVAKGVDQQTHDMNDALQAQSNASAQAAAEQKRQLESLTVLLKDFATIVASFEQLLKTDSADRAVVQEVILQIPEEMRDSRANVLKALAELPLGFAKAIDPRRPGVGVNGADPRGTLGNALPKSASHSSSGETLGQQRPNGIPVGAAGEERTKPNLFQRWFGG